MKYAQQYLADMQEAVSSVPNLERLKGSRILITGACGLICSAITDFLLEYNRRHHAGITIFAAARSRERVEERFKDRSQELQFVPYDATAEWNWNQQTDYIIHGASNACPADFVNEPVETMLANFEGMLRLLRYAGDSKVKRLLYISSSEVYGNKADQSAYRESDYGFIDILNPRACYPSAKRATETLCAAYGREYGVDSVIVRPGHVYGPTATSRDNRASTQFAADVLNNRDIVMKSSGNQLRSYCYVMDCVSAILTVLINGESWQAYNISNKASVVTIRELAECFARASGRRVIFEAPTEKEKAGYNMMSNSSLDAKRLEGLGWSGLFSLERGVRHTLCIMNESKRV